MVTLHTQHLPFAGTTQRLLDIADAADRIRCDPGERHVRGDCAFDHPNR